MTTTMTPRQRWLALLERKPVDRIPTDYTAPPEVTATLLRELNCTNERALWEKLHIDARIDLAPEWKLPHHPDDPHADMWGVRYQKVDYGTGAYEEPCHHPLAGATTVTGSCTAGITAMAQVWRWHSEARTQPCRVQPVR